MAILKLVGAKRYMNKKVSPNVLEKGGLTMDIKDDALVNTLLSQVVLDTLKNEHPMFVVYEPEEVKTEEKPTVKKKAVRKKSTRTRNPST